MQPEAEYDVEAEDVEHRQYAVHHIARLDADVGGAPLVEVGQQVAVAEHRRTGSTRSAAGEDQHGERVTLHLDHVDGGRLLERGERGTGARHVCVGADHVLHRRDRCAVDRIPCSGRSGLQQHHRGAHGAYFPLDLGRRAGGVERHGDGAEAQRGEVGDHELATVGAHERDAVAFGDAECSESAANMADLLAQFAVGRRLTAVDDCHPIRVVRVDDVREIHDDSPSVRMLLIRRAAGCFTGAG